MSGVISMPLALSSHLPMTASQLPILYSFRRCPYAMRARMGLYASHQICELREVLLRDKPDHMLQQSPKGTVPVLILQDGTVLDESLDILDWALERNDPNGWLTPTAGSRGDMQELIAENDGPFKNNLDRYKYPTRYDNVDALEQRAGGLVFLESLNARLSKQPYLFGETESLADIAIFPFIRQFANTDRAWFDALDLKPLQDWLSLYLESALFKAIMLKWPVWSEGQDLVVFPAAAS